MRLQGGKASEAACGPASLGMVLDAFYEQDRAVPHPGIQEIVDWMAQRGWYHDYGVSSEELARAAGHWGQRGQAFVGWGLEELCAALKRGCPVIAAVTVDMELANPGHFVVVRGFTPDGRRVLVNDPLSGVRSWPVEVFLAAWREQEGRGVVVCRGEGQARALATAVPLAKKPVPPISAGAVWQRVVALAGRYGWEMALGLMLPLLLAALAGGGLYARRRLRGVGAGWGDRLRQAVQKIGAGVKRTVQRAVTAGRETARRAVTAVRSVPQRVARAARSVATGVRRTVQRVVSMAQQTARRAVAVARQTARQAVTAVQQTARRAVSAVQQTAQRAVTVVRSGAQELGRRVSSSVDSLKRGAGKKVAAGLLVGMLAASGGAYLAQQNLDHVKQWLATPGAGYDLSPAQATSTWFQHWTSFPVSLADFNGLDRLEAYRRLLDGIDQWLLDGSHIVDSLWNKIPRLQRDTASLEHLAERWFPGEGWKDKLGAGLLYGLAGIGRNPAETALGVAQTLIIDPLEGLSTLAAYGGMYLAPGQFIKDVAASGEPFAVTQSYIGAWSSMRDDHRVWSGLGGVGLLAVGLLLPPLVIAAGVAMGGYGLFQAGRGLAAAGRRGEAIERARSRGWRWTTVVSTLVLVASLLGGAKWVKEQVNLVRETGSGLTAPQAAAAWEEMSWWRKWQLAGRARKQGVSLQELSVLLEGMGEGKPTSWKALILVKAKNASEKLEILWEGVKKQRQSLAGKSGDLHLNTLPEVEAIQGSLIGEGMEKSVYGVEAIEGLPEESSGHLVLLKPKFGGSEALERELRSLELLRQAGLPTPKIEELRLMAYQRLSKNVLP